MKSSFYFVLWIAVYYLLDLVNIPALNNNAFIAAFVLVMIISRIINNNLGNIITAENRRAKLTLFETIYRNEINHYRKKMLTTLIVQFFFGVYFLIAFLWIIFDLHWGDIANRIFEIVIFGAMTAYAIYRTQTIFRNYTALLKVSTLKDYFTSIEEDKEFDNYCAERKTHSFAQILDNGEKINKGFQIISLIFAVLSILLGVWFVRESIPAIVNSGLGNMNTLVLLLYGGLALQAGIKDLT